jgi:hypothetical protein
VKQTPHPADFVGDPLPQGERVRPRIRRVLSSYLIASGLTGEPTAPVIGIAGATNMNS